MCDPTNIQQENDIPLEKGTICNLCNIPFSDIKNLKRHYKNIHKNDPLGYLLQIKHKDTSNNDVTLNLPSHKLTPEPNMLQCTTCNKFFSNKDSLKSHIRKVHVTKDHNCEICVRSFKIRDALIRHIKYVHEGTRDQNCEKCGKTFKGISKLNIHMKSVHDGMRTEPCQFCGKTFAGKGDVLKKHIRFVHEGEKNYICDTCGLSFSENTHLQKHINRVQCT